MVDMRLSVYVSSCRSNRNSQKAVKESKEMKTMKTMKRRRKKEEERDDETQQSRGLSNVCVSNKDDLEHELASVDQRVNV